MLIIRILINIATQGVRANRSEVSRQTVYNWHDRGLLVYDGKRINVPGIVALWKFLIKLR